MIVANNRTFGSNFLTVCQTKKYLIDLSISFNVVFHNDEMNSLHKMFLILVEKGYPYYKANLDKSSSKLTPQIPII